MECKNKNVMETDRVELMSEFFNERANVYDDIHHQTNISWGIEIRNIISNYIDKDNLKILDLGAGTGIELELLFERYPNSEVTCIDVSSEMLKILQNKFTNKKIKIICSDFMHYDFKDSYDYVISVMALHHFTQNEKAALFKKIFNSLKPNGIFINSDYIVDDQNQEDEFLKKYNKIKSNGVLIHFDIPLCLNNELFILNKSGFINAKVVFENKKTKVIVARKLL